MESASLRAQAAFSGLRLLTSVLLGSSNSAYQFRLDSYIVDAKSCCQRRRLPFEIRQPERVAYSPIYSFFFFDFLQVALFPSLIITWFSFSLFFGGGEDNEWTRVR
jgi:hypothetical protein